jgi:hypothetical protein
MTTDTARSGVVKPACTCGKPPEGVSHDRRCPAHDPATCRACQRIEQWKEGGR